MHPRMPQQLVSVGATRALIHVVVTSNVGTSNAKRYRGDKRLRGGNGAVTGGRAISRNFVI